jgi:hypothetical protein
VRRGLRRSVVPDNNITARTLGASMFMEADDLEDLHAEIRDAVRCHIEEAETPAMIRLHFVRDELIAL